LVTPLVLFAGCLVPSNGVVVNVQPPVHVYPEGQCGVAAADAILSYWNVPIDHERLVRDLYIPALRGTPFDLFAWFASKNGLRASVEKGDLSLLESNLRSGVPPVCFLGSPVTGERGHFVVVTGLTRDRRLVRVLSEGQSRWQSASKFTNQWARGEFVVVLLRPLGIHAERTRRRSPEEAARYGNERFPLTARTNPGT
jgi:ABC-type bacteriocin/lantibiotic exporter with double-glycine peptidase domain